MSVFSLSTHVQLLDTVTVNITETAGPTLVAPPTDEFSVYANLLDADDFRKAEIFRGWSFLYRGWKKNAYDPFDGASAGIPHYLAVPLDAPTIQHRIITTDILLITEGYIGIGIGADFTALDTVGQNTLHCRLALERLQQYFKQTRA